MSDLYDMADMLLAEEGPGFEQMQGLQDEREQRALTALMECKRAGANLADLEVLAAELGLRNEWKQHEARTQP